MKMMISFINFEKIPNSFKKQRNNRSAQSAIKKIDILKKNY